jgi:hypothetical protein
MLAPDKRNVEAGVQTREDWKKLPDRLAQIAKEWERSGKIRLMFQNEAGFGRIAESRR